MSVIIKDMEMPKTCSQCEIWSKCWDERPFWFERLEFCPLTEMADRKTENSSEKPNNCEPQTIRCPKCGRTDYIRDMEKDMGIKGSHYKYKCINCNTYIKDEPTISKMEQVDKDINVRSKDEPQMREATAEERQAVRDYIESISEKTGVMFYGKDEPQTERSNE